VQKHIATDSTKSGAIDTLARVAERYAVAITPAMSGLVGDSANDPIARQFLPDARELEALADENADPIGDQTHEVVPGLVHRYPDRVLLKLVQVCAIYCRFCFRREKVGPDNGAPLSAEQLAAAFDYIRGNPGIWEVILSGGDPMVLSPRRIRETSEALDAIGHVKVVRWHTRVPAVAPERVTPELVAALRATEKAVWVALHVNHPRELTEDARAAIARLVDGGVAMVSQSVLLRGVNDDPATLEALFRALVELRVKPYYLHHLDRAPGTAHFRTSVTEGQGLVGGLRRRLSGLAQPTYVLDIPGGHGKVPIGPGYLAPAGQPLEGAQSGRRVTTYVVTDTAGCRHCYTDPVAGCSMADALADHPEPAFSDTNGSAKTET
jgi:lysine 2,3-aminomutase